MKTIYSYIFGRLLPDGEQVYFAIVATAFIGRRSTMGGPFYGPIMVIKVFEI